MKTKERDLNCECAILKLRQALLTFTGIIKDSKDINIKRAANQLYRNVKAIKMSDDN